MDPEESSDSIRIPNRCKLRLFLKKKNLPGSKKWCSQTDEETENRYRHAENKGKSCQDKTKNNPNYPAQKGMGMYMFSVPVSEHTDKYELRRNMCIKTARN